MTDEDISKAAAIMGRKGGKATSSYGHSYFQNLGRKAAAIRWANYKSRKPVENVADTNKDEVVSVDTT